VGSHTRASWDHTPGRRGITHRTIVGSHTESRGITHRTASQDITKTRFFGRFSTLNLLNDSYLTESLNPKTRLKRKERECGIAPWGNEPSLRAGYRRHRSGLTAAGFRKKPSRSGGVYMSASRSLKGQGREIPRTDRRFSRCVQSRRIVEAIELAFGIVADVRNVDRVGVIVGRCAWVSPQ